MFSVALIGPDGAGKTTIGRRVEHLLPLPVTYLYMGISVDSSNVALPTTRLIHAIKRARGAKLDRGGPPLSSRIKPQPKGMGKRIWAGVKSSVRLSNWLAEECYRQGLAWYYQRRGNIVLFDRHFFSDYYAYDIANNGRRQPLSRRIHGFVLKHVYPKPNLVIYLDAPPEVLLARKGEGSITALESRRRDYLQLRDVVKHFAVVDASQPADDVVQDVTELIWDFYKAKTGTLTKVQPRART